MNLDRLSTERLDHELGTWLRAESETRAPVGLVEDVFARTSRTRQARRPWAPRRFPPELDVRRREIAWQPARAIAGLAAVTLLAVVLALGVGRPTVGPGGSASPQPSPSASPSPTPSARASAPAATPAPSGPIATTAGSFPGRRLALGPDVAPIDVTTAFGSIWVADIHANDVRRYDPGTMSELARIPVGSAAWFAVTADSVWVTSQNGTGVSRIDPARNTVVAHVGDVPPCGAPVVAFGDLWQAACDGDAILRIDPRTNALLDTFPLAGHRFLVLAGGRLISVGPEGLASVDPVTGAFSTIGGGRAASEADFAASDGSTIWIRNSAGVVRLDPSDGHALASLPYPTANALVAAGDHAWLTATDVGALEIDLATNAVGRTIPVGGASIPLEADGALWLTDFDASALWRIDL